MVERVPTAMGRIVPTDAELTLLKEMVQQNIPRREVARKIGHSRHWVDRIKKEYNISEQ
jgi:DNA invertase Pin-like site-specific DNA recombinase